MTTAELLSKPKLRFTAEALASIKSNFKQAGVEDMRIQLDVIPNKGELIFELFDIEASEVTEQLVELIFEDLKVYLPKEKIGYFAYLDVSFDPAEQGRYKFSRHIDTWPEKVEITCN